MNAKKWIALLCTAVLSFTSVACGGKAAETYSGQTLTGQVTAIDGSAVTLQLGELTEDTNTPPEMPGGQAPSDAPNGDNTQTPPGAPSGDNAQTPPDAPSGDNTQTPPDAPNGGSNSAPGDANGQPPAKPDGEDSGSTPPEMPSGDGFPGNPGSSFTAGEDTATLDFSSAAITKNGETVALSDLTVGDIVTATVSSGTAVTTAEMVE